MLRRIATLLLALCLAVTGAAWALAEASYSARTPLKGSGSAKRNNIALAVEAIDGTVVPRGSHFSFNETVGARTKNRGYETAPNGRGAYVTGGGVAQAATTLYLALLNAGSGVRIDPVKTYGNRFTDRYVRNPDYAIVTDYDADIDLGFTSRTEDIAIDMWMDDDYVYCVLTQGADTVGPGSGGWFTEEGFAPVGTVAPTRLIASVGLDCGGDANVLKNVQLAADSVNDTSLSSGDEFSFNDIVGPRERKYGYVRAINGRGAKVTGGGVAQVASALWLAIKDRSDFSVLEKATYGEKYNQDYVDSSADAILTDYGAGRDFVFRYTGSGVVTIYTYVTDGWLYCDIYRN